jgi:hypothetical protein
MVSIKVPGARLATAQENFNRLPARYGAINHKTAKIAVAADTKSARSVTERAK